MLNRNELAKTISTHWDDLSETLDVYVPWIAHLVYHQLKKPFKYDSNTLDEIVHIIILQVLQGLQDNKYRAKGCSFRAILRQSAIYRTADYFNQLHDPRLIFENALINHNQREDEDSGFSIEMYEIPSKEGEDEECSIDWIIESLLPVLVLTEQLLASIVLKEQPKDRMKQAEKLISIAVLHTLVYLDFSQPKTVQGKTSKVQYPPKVLRQLIGFGEDFQRRKLDNLKNRQLPEKLTYEKKCLTQTQLINNRILMYRKYLKELQGIKTLILAISGLSEVHCSAPSDHLPQEYLNFVGMFQFPQHHQDIVGWMDYYKNEITYLCDGTPQKIKQIFGIEE